MAGSRIFNGTSDLITLNPSASISSMGPGLSLCAWIYLTDIGGNSDVVFTLSTIAVPIDVYLLVNAGGNGALSGSVAVNSPNASSTGTTAITLSTWTHVALTYDQATDQFVHLYVNGVEDTYFSQTQGGASFESLSGATAYIGTDEGGDFFTGSISEARLYNTALTSLQIAAIAADTSGNPNAGSAAANLVAYLHLCGITSPEPDSSGNSNTGALTGTTAGSASPGYSGCGASASFVPQVGAFCVGP